MTKKIYAIVIGLIMLTACEKQLDVYPHSAVSSDNLSAEDVDILLNGIYNKVQNAPRREAYIIFDMLGGNLISARGSGGVLPLINSTLRPEQSMMSAEWNGYYSALYQVNILLEAASGMQESQHKNEILGIAHFFRGYIYYNLVTRWGAVPILDKNTQEKVARDPEPEVWAFIESELALAMEHAPSFSDNEGDYYYVSREAAKGLMARAKLAQGKSSEAAKLAEEIINSELFQLDDFDKIFRGKQNREEIFSFRNLTAESNITISTLFYTYAHPVGGSYVYAPSNEVMNLYDDADKRKDISIDVYDGNNVINKYPSGQSGTDPVVIVRLAEMYLISAEAQGLAGLSRLNELRNARGLPSINPATEEDYLDAVLLERRRELLAEGFRWYDLVRLHRAQEELDISKAQLKFPIPEEELFLNDLLEQNDGY